jgi:predicted ATPase
MPRKRSRSIWPNTLVRQPVLGPVNVLNLFVASTVTFIYGPQGSGKTGLVDEALTSLGK